MGFIQLLLYRRDLANYPSPIPYEQLSRWYAFKLQRQGYYHDLSVGDIFKQKVCIPIRNKMRDILFVKVLTEHPKTHWVHTSPGMYAHYPKPCRPDCKYCEQKTYIVHTVRYKFKLTYRSL